MNPVCSFCHFLSGWENEGSFLRYIFFNFSWVLFINFEHSTWYNCCADWNASNLSSKEVLFAFMEVRISKNSAFQITWKAKFNLTGNGNVSRYQIWKCCPFVLVWWVTNPVGKLIYTWATWLHISRLFFLCCWSLSRSFSDVVIFFSAIDLTPETKFLCTWNLCQIL